jgi:ribosomal protein S12 methylthiotransferase accessory factor
MHPTRPDSATSTADLAPLIVSELCGIATKLNRIQKDHREPERPYIYRAVLSNHRFLCSKEYEEIVCSGKGLTEEAAISSAIGEVVERYCGASWDERDIRYCMASEIEGEFLDPQLLVLYAPDQYKHLPYSPYSPESRLGWVPARSLLDGRRVWVPALAVYLGYEVKNKAEYLFPSTSNGLAAGTTIEEAILKAIYEVIERDAFLLTWMNRLPPERIQAANHPDPAVKDLIAAYERRGVRIELYRLATDAPCSVFLALGIDDSESGPSIVVGLGANSSQALAAKSAVLEVAQIRPPLRIRLKDKKTKDRLDELVVNPQLVRSLDDHDLLYASSAMRGAFDFLRASSAGSPDWDSRPRSTRELLDGVAEGLGEIGCDALFVDTTTVEIRGLGLSVARAILPDFQPIHFGYGEERLAGKRLFELPSKLGLRAERTRLEDLNPLPHPLS